MTNAELTAIEGRANAATREPWIVGSAYVPTASLSAVSVYGMGMEIAECQMVRDGEFIAHARVDVPALVAEVRTLRAERDALRDQWSGLLIEQARLVAQRDDAIAERDALRKLLRMCARTCDTLDHGPGKDFHESDEMCPIVVRIDAALAVQPTTGAAHE